jgi:hypothetical protein
MSSGPSIRLSVPSLRCFTRPSVCSFVLPSFCPYVQSIRSYIFLSGPCFRLPFSPPSSFRPPFCQSIPEVCPSGSSVRLSFFPTVLPLSFNPSVHMFSPYVHTFAHPVPAFVYSFVRLRPLVRLSVSPFQKFVHLVPAFVYPSVCLSGRLSDFPSLVLLSICSSATLSNCDSVYLTLCPRPSIPGTIFPPVRLSRKPVRLSGKPVLHFSLQACRSICQPSQIRVPVCLNHMIIRSFFTSVLPVNPFVCPFDGTTLKCRVFLKTHQLRSTGSTPHSM